MRRVLLMLLALCAAMGYGGRAHAQQSDAMPFDIPYGEPVSLEQAKKAAAAAEAEAMKHNWKMAIAVVEPNGTLVYFEKLPGTQYGSVVVAQGKARAAATFRRPTKAFEDAIAGGRNAVLGLEGALPIEGGIPLVSGGKIVGAIGCSGGASAQDGEACKAGMETIH
jgi:glc operon protein GlcG